MTNLISIMKNDLARRIKHGSTAPQKNQFITVSPGTIRNMIDSENPGFLKSVLGDDHSDSPSAKLGRKARKALRSNDEVLWTTNFDLYTKPVTSDPTIKRTLDMLASGQTWREAGFLDWMMEQIAQKGTLDNCRSLEDVTERYRILDHMANQMRSGKTLRSPGGMFGRYGHIDGIIVAIGRGGDIIFCGKGKHRLALAIGLEVAAIPVSVTAVHVGALENGVWQLLLDQSRKLATAVGA